MATLMRDLLIIVPTRGRPVQMARLIDACNRECRARTDIVIGIDDDDPMHRGYKSLSYKVIPGRDLIIGEGPRKGLVEWTNGLAKQLGPEYRYLASLGDDHMPRTPGWDTLLISAIEEMGGTGFAYGNDLNPGVHLPTAWVVSRDIVDALGWMCYPGLAHYCADNVIMDLGTEAGLIKYVPEVIIEHMHPTMGKAEFDDTYTDAGGFTVDHPDYDDYLLWRAGEMAADMKKIKALRA